MKVVLDTNIYISGLLVPTSKPGKVLELFKEKQLDIISSESLIEEIQGVLHYPKIKKRLNWTSEQIEEYCIYLKFFTDLVDIQGVIAHVPADNNDNHILATLLAGQADYLITGDADLLSLKNKYSIITINEFYQLIM